MSLPILPVKILEPLKKTVTLQGIFDLNRQQIKNGSEMDDFSGHAADILAKEQGEVFGILIRDTSEITSHNKSFSLIKFSVVRSGYISGGCVRDLLHYNEVIQGIICLEESKVLSRRQRILVEVKLGPQKKPKHSFVSVRVES